jgi:hypothetical protein
MADENENDMVGFKVGRDKQGQLCILDQIGNVIIGTTVTVKEAAAIPGGGSIEATTYGLYHPLCTNQISIEFHKDDRWGVVDTTIPELQLLAG